MTDETCLNPFLVNGRLPFDPTMRGSYYTTSDGLHWLDAAETIRAILNTPPKASWLTDFRYCYSVMAA